MTAAGGDADPTGATGPGHVQASPALWAGRLLGAGLLAWMGWIHLHLWSEGYKHVGTIGPLFMADFAAAVAAALVLLAVPTYRLVAAAALVGACLALATLAGLVISIHVGLFGFTDSWNAPFARMSVAVEVSAAAALLATVAGAWVGGVRDATPAPGDRG